MARFSPRREMFIPPNSTPIKDDESGAVVYIYQYEKIPSQFFACAFKARAKRITWVRVYKSETKREQDIQNWFEYLSVIKAVKENPGTSPEPRPQPGFFKLVCRAIARLIHTPA